MKSSNVWWSRVPTKTKARPLMEQHLFSSQLGMGTLKLSNFWLSRVPRTTKARQTMEQRLFLLLRIRATLKLSDFWWSPVPKKTNIGQMMEQHLFAEQLRKGHLEVVRFLVESGANKDQGTTDFGATPLSIAAHQGPP